MPDDRVGWTSVAGGFLTHFVAFGISYSFGVFFDSIGEAFGQGAGPTAWIYGLQAAAMLGSSRPLGRLADRIGARPVVVAGALLMGVGLVLTAAATAMWQVWITYGLVFGIGTGCEFAPVQGAVARAVDRRKGLAVGIVLAGSGIGTLVLAPTAAALVEAIGWRATLVVFAAASVVLVLIAAAMLHDSPQPVTTETTPSLWLDHRFRLLYAAMFFGAFGYIVPFAYLVPFAEDQGVSTSTAALMLATLGLLSTIGRIVFAALADRAGWINVLRATTALMAALLLVWPVIGSTAGLFAFAALFGAGAGGWVSVLPGLVADYFGERSLKANLGAVYTAMIAGTLLAPPIVGALYDSLGNFTLATLFAGVTAAVNWALLLPLPQTGSTAVLDPAERLQTIEEGG